MVSSNSLERMFESNAYRPVFGDAKSLASIQKQKELLKMSDDTSLLLDTFGKDNWLNIIESPKLLTTPAASLKQCFWQLREPVTFNVFCRHFRMSSSNAIDHPVINVVLENESSLQLVKYIGDILAWHNFLFSHVPSDTTREQVLLFCYVL